MNTNVLLNKIVEKGLDVGEALEVCAKFYEPNKVTIGDAIWIKNKLGLSNYEAVEIFLS